MSLRAEIRQAIDEVAPPAPGLVHEVIDSVFDRAGTRAGRRQSLRNRTPLALVAALVVLALVVGLVIGGRILRNANTPIPSGHHHSTSAIQVQMAELEARPIQLPALQAGEPCPSSAAVYTSGIQYGNGPVWLVFGSTTSTTWGKYIEVTFRYVVTANPAFEGDNTLPALAPLPIVVRGQDLKLGLGVGFAGTDATGAVVADDPAHAPPVLLSELAIDTNYPGRVEDNSHKLGHIANYGLTTAQLGLRAGSSGCFGLQIDSWGQPQTQVITFQV